MTATQFRAALKRLGFVTSDRPNDLGLSEAARFFQAGPRTVREWAERGPPAAVAITLQLMTRLRLDRAKVIKLLGD
jgi:hypothetical protein